MEEHKTNRSLVWRVFFNVASLKGPALPVCIDQGPGSQRIWVKGARFDCPTFFAFDKFGGHPRMWNQVEGELHITSEGEAIFTHPEKEFGPICKRICKWDECKSTHTAEVITQ